MAYASRLLVIVFSLLLFFVPANATSYSTRALGMGDVYPLTGKDPAGMFYNPAYLAKVDSLKYSFDNVSGPKDPKSIVTMSLGDAGFAESNFSFGQVYHLAQAWNTFSFLRTGLGIEFHNQQKDFNLGLDMNLSRNVAVSAALLNSDGAFLPNETTYSIAYKTEDEDQCLALNFSSISNFKFGYENQFGPKSFYRIGYKSDHPTLGLTLPLQYFDFDFALDFAKEGLTGQWGIEVFRNEENKRVNSKHTINFGKAILGEDKFMNIEGYNIHYVDSGSGYPLVLLGGAIHTTHHWDPYIKELSEHFRVINIDHLGAGDSDKPQYFFGYTVQEQGQIINELLNRLEIKEAYLLGYCYGGTIAFYLGGQYPEKYKKLVIIEGFVRGINTVPLDDENRKESKEMRQKVEYLDAYMLRDFVALDFRIKYPYFNSKMWYEVNTSILYLDLRPEVANISGPVLYYAGTASWAKDYLTPTKEYIKANMENLTYIEKEGAGHDVDRFNETEFMKEILNFYGN